MLVLFVRGLPAEEAQNVKAGLQILRWGLLRPPPQLGEGGKTEPVTLLKQLKKKKKTFPFGAHYANIMLNGDFRGQIFIDQASDQLYPASQTIHPFPPKQARLSTHPADYTVKL